MHEEFSGTFNIVLIGHERLCTYSYDHRQRALTVDVEGVGVRTEYIPDHLDHPKRRVEVEMSAESLARELIAETYEDYSPTHNP